VIKKPQNGPQGELTEDIYPVLFSSPSPADGFEEDRMVYVWNPWYAVELSQPGISVGYGIEAQLAERRDGMDRQCKYALLCSRYLLCIP
jgi:hypothetical protein